MNMKRVVPFILGITMIGNVWAQDSNKDKNKIQQVTKDNSQRVLGSTADLLPKPKPRVVPGSERTQEYLHLIKDKKVGLLVNQTSVVNDSILLPDFLISNKIKVTKIFTPEHGFRGTADAGAHVASSTDAKTGLPIISLYGNNKKPSLEQLKDVDVIIYDLQDVGARFYTYISSLEYMLDACAEAGKEMIILDRPNPIGFMVDGPVLEPKFKSFVGMQPIPVIYGMTPGEYAKMLIGEKWIKNAAKAKLTVVTCDKYDHLTAYTLPVAPSPNLKNTTAVVLYPSLCLFEGTVISVGRGTDMPFQQYGSPDLKAGFGYTFTPKSQEGATNPMYKDQVCYGEFVATTADEALKKVNMGLNLKWLMAAYKYSPNKDKFFNNFFNSLAGNATLKQQIIDGKSEVEIKASWQPGIKKFKEIRKKYLLYKDFE